MHCKGVTPQPTNQGDCHVVGDGGVSGSGSDYGPTMYGSEGDDDDCKYHVTWSVPPIAENQDATFTFSASYLATGMPNPPACADCPVTGLDQCPSPGDCNSELEVYLNDTHPAPNTNQVVTAIGQGKYTAGPIQFDAPGKWTVRFHLFELCSDVTDDSPHGHAAFYVDVP